MAPSTSTVHAIDVDEDEPGDISKELGERRRYTAVVEPAVFLEN